MTASASAEAAPRPRSRWLAALLTVLAPGVGHLYIGQRRRALIIVILNFALGAFYVGAAFLLPPAFWPIAVLALTMIGLIAIYYVGAIMDAVRLARRPDAAPRVRWYVLIVAALALWAANQAIALTFPAIRAHWPWRTYSVPSESMQPTVRIGEWFVADNRYYRSQAPARGEIVTYLLPSDNRTVYVKRIIALAGDRVAFRGNRAVVNGVTQSEPFADLRDDAAYYATTAEVTVPADHIFVAGDNRANSIDSRVERHGFVPVRNLTGRATEIVLSQEGDRFGLWIGSPPP